ncbi:MAG: cell division protein ZapA [Bacteroides sp.]|nr:cell division protein ZapA [Bacteroides sp.]MCM1412850.1 cell division protein ZapA [Bacteroides sp.]MCM1471519.1 cell division protein ZapA [Bacteroides sp.]
MKDKLDITLRIGSSRLSLTIKPEEEAVLREVAKEVNHAYESFKQRFPGSPDSEIMAKVTLLFARGFLNLSAQAQRAEQFLGDFEAELDQMLIETSAIKH